MNEIPLQPPATNIIVAWSRRTSPRAAKTTDQDGYILMEFGLVSGERFITLAKRLDLSTCSMWQKVPYSSPAYCVNVEIWQSKEDGTVCIYAFPDREMQAKL